MSADGIGPLERGKRRYSNGNSSLSSKPGSTIPRSTIWTKSTRSGPSVRGSYANDPGSDRSPAHQRHANLCRVRWRRLLFCSKHRRVQLARRKCRLPAFIERAYAACVTADSARTSFELDTWVVASNEVDREAQAAMSVRNLRRHLGGEFDVIRVYDCDFGEWSASVTGASSARTILPRVLRRASSAYASLMSANG